MADRPDQIPAASVQPGSDFYGNMTLAVLVRLPDGEKGEPRYESVEYVLGWDAANTLYSNLHGVMRVWGEERMQNAATGDCETCGNARLVMTEKSGRPWTVACPDCRPRYDAAAPAYPKPKADA